MRRTSAVPVATWEDVVAIASKLPRLKSRPATLSTLVEGRQPGLARARAEAEGALVLMCDLAEKEALLDAGDPTFSTTSHYDNHASKLVHLDPVDENQLTELVAEAWLITALCACTASGIVALTRAGRVLRCPFS